MLLWFSLTAGAALLGLIFRWFSDPMGTHHLVQHFFNSGECILVSIAIVCAGMWEILRLSDEHRGLIGAFVGFSFVAIIFGVFMYGNVIQVEVTSGQDRPQWIISPPVYLALSLTWGIISGLTATALEASNPASRIRF